MLPVSYTHLDVYKRQVRDCFRKIDTSSKYLLSLINDILDMSKIETDKMEIAHELFDFKSFAEELNQIIYPQTLEKEVGYETVSYTHRDVYKRQATSRTTPTW